MFVHVNVICLDKKKKKHVLEAKNAIFEGFDSDWVFGFC